MLAKNDSAVSEKLQWMRDFATCIDSGEREGFTVNEPKISE